MKRYNNIPMILIAWFAVLFSAANLHAENEFFTSLVEEETLLIVHLDVSKIDVDKVFENNRESLDILIDSIGLRSEEFQKDFIPNDREREMFNSIINDWGQLATITKGGKGFLETVLGVDEAYLVFKLKGPDMLYIAAPKKANTNVPFLKSMLESNEGFVLRETEKMLFLYVSFPMTGVGKDELEQLASELELKPKFRSEFQTAYENVKDYPFRTVFAPPAYVKKVLKEVKPTLPEPFKEIELDKMVCGLSWKAIGFDPEKPDFIAIAEAENEFAALELRHHGRKFLETAGKMIVDWIDEGLEREAIEPKVKDDIRLFGKLLEGENLKIVCDTLLPEPKGKRFEIHADQESVKKFMDDSMPILAEFIKAPIMASRAAARRMQCTNNLKLIFVAFFNYHDAYGTFPPAFSVDENGKPLHSWRVLILPFIEQSALYDSIRLDEPWNSEHNKQFHSMMPVHYRCPECTKGEKNRDASYCMVVGEDTLGRTDGKGLKIQEITDGTSNTIGIIERKSPVCWMEPVDITQEDAHLGINKKETGIGATHSGGVNAAICDGSIRYISDTIAPDVLKAILTVAGGESASF